MNHRRNHMIAQQPPNEKEEMKIFMNLTALPEAVIQEGRFCCWRYEERNGKKTKVPYQPVTGLRAQSNDRSSFVPFGTAAGAEGYDGIGIGIFDGICAIDLDHCLTDGKPNEKAAEIIRLMHSYTETSPGGDGVHILFRAPGFRYDTNRYYIMNHRQGIEVYVSGATSKYVTLTGNRITRDDFGDRTEELRQLLERYMLRPNGKAEAENPAANAINAGNALPDDADLLHRAMNSRNGEAFARLWRGDISGYPSHSEADHALCSRLAFWTGRDAGRMDTLFRQSGLMRPKWDRPQSGSTYGQITIRNAIRHCTEVYKPRAVPESTPLDEEAQPAPPPLFQPLVPLKPQYSDLPSFPVECLPANLRDYVTAVAEHSQTAPDLAAVISLGVLAVCLQGKYQVEGMPGYVEPLSLYTVVIAAPGERKSSVMRDMTGVIYEYEKEFNQAREAEIRANQHEREALQRQISALEKRLERKSTPQLEQELQMLQNQLADYPVIRQARFTADDCSSEALTSLLASSGGRFAVISTEGGIFDIMAGRYSSKVNIDVWLKGHCGDAIRVDRLGRDAEYIPHPALSAILSIQPSVLDEIMANATMTGRGLIARFLYASPPSRIGKRVFVTSPIAQEITAAYKSLVFRLMAIPAGDEPATLRLSDQATETIAQCFAQHEQYLVGEGQEISDWANKYIGTVLRIAGLLHAAQADEISSDISSATMENAIRIGQYFLAHARYAYSVMGTDLSVQKAQFVLAKIMKRKVIEIKRSELFQMCRGKFFKKTEDLFPTLELLEDRGYLRLEQPEHFTAGRPPDVRVILNPAAVPLAAAG